MLVQCFLLIVVIGITFNYMKLFPNKYKAIQVIVDQELYKKIEEAAKKDDRKISSYVRVSLKRILK